MNVSTSKRLIISSYMEDVSVGDPISIDRIANKTAGAGMINFCLHRTQNIHWRPLDAVKAQRANAKGQTACCLWFTGLSGSGKSTVANALETKLLTRGKHTFILDGDNIRHGLCRDLGFTEIDRVENIRGVTEVARFMTDAGLITIVALISPFWAERQTARQCFDDGEFFEIFIDTPQEICEQRDPKGLYAKARAGEIENFIGISSPYEPPADPDMRLEGGQLHPDELADQIIELLEQRGCLNDYKYEPW